MHVERLVDSNTLSFAVPPHGTVRCCVSLRSLTERLVAPSGCRHDVSECLSVCTLVVHTHEARRAVELVVASGRVEALALLLGRAAEVGAVLAVLPRRTRPVADWLWRGLGWNRRACRAGWSWSGRGRKTRGAGWSWSRWSRSRNRRGRRWAGCHLVTLGDALSLGTGRHRTESSNDRQELHSWVDLHRRKMLVCLSGSELKSEVWC